ncbi:MAG: hydrogenase maturation protease [Thermoplasmata archaeon]|nr:MAG: hydrogenase maturation protease [Thermoplasmata archaeon]
MSLVIFLGNEFAGDDSAGYEAYRKAKEKISARMLYLGTDIFELSRIYENEERLVIIDAFHGIDEVVHLKNEELFNLNDKSMHAHRISAVEGLKILKATMKNFPKEVHLIGIPAKSIEKRTFSEDVIEKAVKMLKKIVKT